MRIHSHVHVCVCVCDSEMPSYSVWVFLLGVFECWMFKTPLQDIARTATSSSMWVCLKMVSTPKNPMVNDHYPILSLLNGYNWGYTPFSDIPMWPMCLPGLNAPMDRSYQEIMVFHPPTQAACPRCHLCTWSKVPRNFFSETSIELGKESDMKQPRSHSFQGHQGPWRTIKSCRSDVTGHLEDGSSCQTPAANGHADCLHPCYLQYLPVGFGKWERLGSDQKFSLKVCHYGSMKFNEI